MANTAWGPRAADPMEPRMSDLQPRPLVRAERDGGAAALTGLAHRVRTTPFVQRVLLRVRLPVSPRARLCSSSNEEPAELGRGMLQACGAGMRTLVGAIAVAIISSAVAGQTLRDDFDAAVLDTYKWSTSQIRPHQIRFPRPGRCGPAAIAILTRDGDGGINCAEGGDCQRTELRTSKAAWPSYDGKDVWFSFSFRINANVPSTGSARTIIGQWKAPGDNSPFVAQRFDNGVFHITVQDNDTRRVVAKAEGDPDRMVAAQQLLAQIDRNDVVAVSGIRSLQSLYQLQHDQPGLSYQFTSSKLIAALQFRSRENPEADELSNLLRLPSSAVVMLFSEVAFVVEPERYLGSSGLEIFPEANRLLPDPRRGWVDMT